MRVAAGTPPPVARANTKLSPAARQRLVLRYMRIFMGGIYAAVLAIGAVMSLTSGDWAYLLVGLCLLGLSFPSVAAVRDGSTMPDLEPLSANQRRRLKQLGGATAVLVFACIVLFEARAAGPPVPLWVATVAAGTCSAFYSLAALVG